MLALVQLNLDSLLLRTNFIRNMRCLAIKAILKDTPTNQVEAFSCMPCTDLCYVEALYRQIKVSYFSDVLMLRNGALTAVKCIDVLTHSRNKRFMN